MGPLNLTLILVLFFIRFTSPGKLKPKIYYKHLGCYVEKLRPDGVLPYFFYEQLHPMITSSLSTCLLHCVSHKFFYAAVDKENCGCANKLTNDKGEMEKAEDSDCSYSCNDEPFINVPCGAKRRQSVYEITHSSVLNVYVGCYHLHPLDASMKWVPLLDNSPFSHEFTKIDDGKATHCIKHCSKSGFKYAAVFSGQSCGCDDVIKRKTKKISNMYCTYPCLDLKLGTCGSLREKYIAIYLSNEEGIKWMKRAIDTEFLIKELKIKDQSLDSFRIEVNLETEENWNISTIARNETKRERKILGIKFEFFIGGCVGIGVFVIGIIVGICYWIKKRNSGDDDNDEEDEDTKKRKARRKAKAKVVDFKKNKNMKTKDVDIPKFSDLKYKKEEEPKPKKKKKKGKNKKKKSKSDDDDDPTEPLIDT